MVVHLGVETRQAALSHETADRPQHEPDSGPPLLALSYRAPEPFLQRLYVRRALWIEKIIQQGSLPCRQIVRADL